MTEISSERVQKERIQIVVLADVINFEATEMIITFVPNENCIKDIMLDVASREASMTTVCCKFDLY